MTEIENNYSSLKELHSLVIKRLYHEDQLLVQRTSTLVAAHAFLVVGFIEALNLKNEAQGNIVFILGSFALIISIFQLTWGYRTHRMILFLERICPTN